MFSRTGLNYYSSKSNQNLDNNNYKILSNKYENKLEQKIALYIAEHNAMQFCDLPNIALY